MNMEKDLFADTTYGKAALQKFGNVSESFRIFSAGWLGDKPEEWTIMKVTGAEFRKAKTGKNVGKLSIMLPGTTRNAFVTKDEMRTFENI